MPVTYQSYTGCGQDVGQVIAHVVDILLRINQLIVLVDVS